MGLRSEGLRGLEALEDRSSWRPGPPAVSPGMGCTEDGQPCPDLSRLDLLCEGLPLKTTRKRQQPPDYLLGSHCAAPLIALYLNIA